MTDEMFDETGRKGRKGRSMRGETDPEKAARSEEDTPDVEGHVVRQGPERAALREDEDGNGEEGIIRRKG
jgi:hypothetical protein